LTRAVPLGADPAPATDTVGTNHHLSVKSSASGDSIGGGSTIFESAHSAALGLAPPIASPSFRFVPLRLLGTGATSDVWKAEDRLTGIEVALKVALHDEGASVLALEAERLASAFSPHLPEIFEIGRIPAGAPAALAAGRPYVAMSWMPGQPLGSGALDSEEERRAVALVVARDIGEALAHLDAAGMAHGDVKPANILVEQGRGSNRGPRRASLVDLGLSADALERMPIGGTPRYLPPEIWVGNAGGDGRARDRFALGLVLAEILVPDLTESARLAEDARRARLPPPFDAWCAALLAPDPGARPRAAWIADQAQRAAAGSPGRAPQAAGLPSRAPQAAGPPDRAEHWRRMVRAAYLGSRRAEIAWAARAASVAFHGGAGDWLRHAVEVQRSALAFGGEAPHGGAVQLGDADALARSRWLVTLVGSPAARWSLASVARASDEQWARGLERLVSAREPATWSVTDVEAAVGDAAGAEPTAARAKDGAAHGETASHVELALALSGEGKRSAIETIEAGLFAGTGRASERTEIELRRAAADALRRMGEAGRALALLAADPAPDVHTLRAEIARRAGDRELADAEARAALAHDPNDGQAHAVLARILVDQGNARAALALLTDASPSGACHEVRAIALVMSGDAHAARKELEIAEALAATEEARGRAAGLFGYVAHQSGDFARARSSYARAAEHAERAGALVEEATYLTGEAAAAVDEGAIGRALETARRASLLFEHLGRPADAARALLARAASFSTAGAKLEATFAAREARERARFLGDARAEAFACWALTDAGEPEDPDAVEAARFAARLLSPSGTDEDRLRALARLLRHVPADVGPDKVPWADALASQGSTLTAARLEWWGARAERWLAGAGAGRAETPVAEICELARLPAPIAARGPALAAAAALAARLGNGSAVRLLARAQAEAARALVSGVPDDLRESAASLPWVRSAHAPEASGVTAEQIADFEGLVRALGARDSLRPLLEQVLDSLILWTGVERGLLLLRNPIGKLVPRAARNLARADLEGEQRALSYSLAARAIELGEPVVAVDASGEMPSLHESVHALKLRSVLAVPLVARGKALGVVYLDDRMRRGAFGPSELAWVKLVATLAAVAIADAHDQILLRRVARRAERAGRALAHELSRREVELDVIGRELLRAQGGLGTRFRYDAIIGKSRTITEMLKVVDRVTVSGVPVLLVGESGSGKELVARAIHGNGPRRAKTFVGENCAAIPEPLLESTLFGHVRGAFTGADRGRAGLFEIAHEGTLFLDEVGEMSLPMQAKLLRALEEGEVRPLGSERGRKVDVRIVAATHRNLDQMVKAGQFREDLFYRLNVITIHVPALRDRSDDIPLLVHHFVEKHGDGRHPRVSNDALARLCRYAWPGNVRQLENEIRRAIILCDGAIQVENLSPEIQNPHDQASSERIGLRVRPRVDALETELVRAALLETHGNQTKAAHMLGLSRFGLQKMIKRLGIKPPS
jgi:transcriptional regulator with GAF, ATPase, and Fis domain